MRNIGKAFVSIVLPAYNEAENIPFMYEAIKAELAKLKIGKYEIIVVNDGSSDDTVSCLAKLGLKDKKFKAVTMAFNVGHQLACYAGMKMAKGDVVITMDADGQHPPVLFKEIFQKWAEGFEIVNTVRVSSEKIGLAKKVTAALYYFILNKIGNIKVTPNTADFRLLSRDMLNALLSYEDRDIFLRGLVAKIRCPQAFVSYTAANRKYGESKYSLTKMLSLAWNGIVTGSKLPLKLSVFLSFLIFMFATIYSGYEMYQYFNGVKMPDGFMTLVVLLSIYAGMTLFILGILGSYIGRIYINSKRQPLFIVSQKVNL